MHFNYKDTKRLKVMIRKDILELEITPSMVEHMLSVYKAPGSISSTTKKDISF